MPHAPDHNPNEQEKIIICGSQAKTYASAGIAAIEALDSHWPGAGHTATLLDVICRIDPAFAGRLGPALTTFCEAGETVAEMISAGLDLLLADVRGGEGE